MGISQKHIKLYEVIRQAGKDGIGLSKSAKQAGINEKSIESVLAVLEYNGILIAEFENKLFVMEVFDGIT